MRKLIFFLFILAAVTSQSCSSTSKIKRSEKTTLDSVSVTKVDSAATKIVDTVSLKKTSTVKTTETTNDYTVETVIEFDTATEMTGPLFTGTVSDITAADYFPRIRKITIKETGRIKKTEASQASTYDSAGKKTTEATTLTKTGNTKVTRSTATTVKEKDTVSYWRWLWLIPILLLLAVLYRYRKKIKAFLTLGNGKF